MRRQRSMRVVWWTALLVAALALVTTIRQTVHRPGTPFGDFAHLTLGAECLLDRCNPYDFKALNAEALKRGEDKPRVWPEAAVYPPSSLLVALPFARAGWPAGAQAFDYSSGLIFGFACVLMVWKLRLGAGPALLVLVLSLVCNPIVATLEFANPALLTAALTALACMLLLEPVEERSVIREVAAWTMLGVALALKPQLAAGAAAVLLSLPATRPAALKAVALSALLLVAACLAYRVRLGSFQLLQQLQINLRMSLLPGSTSDFSPLNDESFDFLNLQTSYSRLPQLGRAQVGLLAWLTTGTLAAMAALLFARTRAALRMPWTLLAAVTAISLMPVYHRGYDRVIAVLLVPAAEEIRARSKALSWLYAGAVSLWVANDTLLEHKLKRWHFKPQNPIEELMICAVLLFVVWRFRDRPTSALGHAAEVGSIAS